MTELSSQFWEATLVDERARARRVRRAALGARRARRPRDARARPRRGRSGIARIEDLANVDSAFAVLDAGPRAPGRRRLRAARPRPGRPAARVLDRARRDALGDGSQRRDEPRRRRARCATCAAGSTRRASSTPIGRARAAMLAASTGLSPEGVELGFESPRARRDADGAARARRLRGRRGAACT